MDDKEDKNQQISSKKTATKYYCEICDFNTFRKSNYNDHLFTAKHQRMTKEDNGGQKGAKTAKFQQLTKFKCCCGKEYKYRQGLWKHRIVCDEYNSNSDTMEVDKNIQLTEKELIDILVEQNKKLMNLLETGTNNTNNTNNLMNNCNNTINNKTFNLNVYLNETCKDAMNISDFISSIDLNLEDLENTGRKGYVEGISNIFFKNLNNLETHMRPIHCSDSKREILYIKENDKWEKETDNKPILTKAIKTIANENIKQIKHWRDKYPDCTKSDSRKNDLYLQIVSNSMNGLTEEEGKRNIQKIISNVAKGVIIEKY
jgi:hypothetical protein